MKILFLCGSLEPGSDGVGDYTRRLAGELIRGGNSIALAALTESKLKSVLEIKQYDGKTEIPVLRVPSSVSDNKRSNLLSNLIKYFTPDLISLQYVPYSFSKYGIPLMLGSFLSKLQGNNIWHVMVHEAYLGTDETGLKNGIIKLLQILSLRQIQKKLKPILFHTSIAEYQSRLNKIRVESNILGLFGNIEVLEPNKKVLIREGIETERFKGIYFGSAPRIEDHEIFANEIRDFCQFKRIKLQLTFCGKSGPHGEKFMTSIKKICKINECEVISLGKLPPKKLSSLFSSSDFGVSRVPPKFLGKSGSTITMLEHGLPVWVPLEKDQSINENLDFRSELCFKDLTYLGTEIQRTHMINRLSQVSNKFMSDIQELRNFEFN